MTLRSRGTTLGNNRADYTKVRKDFSNLPAFAQATLRNAVPRNGVTPDKGDIGGTDVVNPYKLQRLSDIISNNINAVTDLRAITPYIDKAELIWNTILLYPNGKQDKILTYDTIPSKFKNTALHTELLKIWEEYFTNNYKIEQDLSTIINDVLWNTGSYCLFNLSRPGLDYLINGSEIDPRHQRTGNENYEDYRRKAIDALSHEYGLVDNKEVRLKNLGLIRNPNAKKVSNGRVSGLEQLFTSRAVEDELEFNLFGDLDSENLFNITFTDNPACLYQPKLKENDRLRSINTVMGVEDLDFIVDTSMKGGAGRKDPERSRDPIKDGETNKKQKKAAGPEATTENLDEKAVIDAAYEIYRSRNIRHQSMQFVKPLDTLSVPPYGRGLVWHIPSEAVIPIHYNGQNKAKCDYIFLVDPEDGTFLKNTVDPEYYQSISKTKGGVANKPKSGSENGLISSLRTIQEGKECEFDMSEFAQLAEASLIKRWTSSILSDKAENISITLDEETNKIWLSRIFRRQGVRCLYVPGEAVTYIALKYNRLGTGQSLTQLAKMHIARLAAFDIADTLANLERAQPHTLMTITHGKDDGDPTNTAEIARAAFFDQNPKIHSLMNTAQLSVPMIVESMRNSALTVRVNPGENPLVAMPEISLERMEKNFFQPVDEASRTKVLNDISNYFSTPRSWLDVQDDSNNFKIEAVTEHEMVSNQAANWQSSLAIQITDHQRKHIRVNAPVLTEMANCIRDNKKLWKTDSKTPLEGEDDVIIKTLLSDFLTAVYCSFPERSSIETTDKLRNQLDAIDQLVAKWMEIASTQESMKHVAASLGLQTTLASPEEITAHVKAYFLAEAFRRYNIPMPFDDIVNDGKGGGIASLVQGIVHQKLNAQEFLVQYLTALKETESSFKDSKEVKKLLKLLGEGEEGGLEDGLDGSDGTQLPVDENAPLVDEPPLEDGALPSAEDEPVVEGEEVKDELEDEAGPKEEGEKSEATGQEEEEDTATAEEKAAGKNDPSSPHYNPF
jgi:hypothetical protein